MKLGIKNIGVIDSAEIELDGITVIAGINNKGKSTVGKTLFALLHEMDEWDKIYTEIWSGRIYSFLVEQSAALEDFGMEISGAKRRRTGKANLLARRYSVNEDFFAAIEDTQLMEGDSDLAAFLTEYAAEYIALYVKKEQKIISQQFKEVISDWTEKTAKKVQTIELDELVLQRGRLQSSFGRVFGDQYRKIGTDASHISFEAEGRTVEISIKEEWEMDIPLRIHSRVHFLESPRIFDMLSDTRYGHVQREYLQYLMRPNTVVQKNVFRSTPGGAEASVETGKSVTEIIQKLTGTMKGRADFYQKVGLEFKDERFQGTIHAVNVSTGVKALALLEYALRIGAILENDILILDEPEINLHPEWQVIYAGALVRLQKYFGIRVLLTTHSPYFIRAIECYTDIESQMSRLNVYRAENCDDKSGVTFENLSYSEFGLTSLYDDLSASLDQLEEQLEEGTGEDA